MAPYYKNGEPGKPPVQMNCSACGTLFFAKAAQVASGRRKYCSRACKGKFRSEQYVVTRICAYCGSVEGLPPNKATKYCSHDCANKAYGKMAAKNDKWYQTSSGYLAKTVNKKTVSQHRNIMESMLGRPLAKHETVHHRDGNRKNNDPSNLELWSSRHGSGQRVEDKLDFCKSFLSEYGIEMPNIGVSYAVQGISGLV